MMKVRHLPSAAMIEEATDDVRVHGDVIIDALPPTDRPIASRPGFRRADAAWRKYTMLPRTPMGRLGSTGETAYVVTFLASDRSSCVTGQTI